MKTLVYIFIFCFALYSKLQGQGFNIEYGLPYNNSEQCIGKAFEFNGHYFSLISTQSTAGIKYIVIELSKYGDIIKSFEVQDSVKNETYLDWIKSSENEFYILSKEAKGKDIFSMYLLKLDNKFTIESKTLLDIGFTYPGVFKLKALQNGNIVLYGQAANANVIFTSGIYFEINKLGTKIWNLKYGGGYDSGNLLDFEVDINDNTFILWSSYNPKFFTSQYHILKYNSKHELLWDKVYNLNSEYFNHININSKNQIVNIGRGFYGNINKHLGNLLVDLKYNDGGDISTKTYFNYETRPLDCVVNSTGDFICSGYTYKDSLFNGGLIIKISEFGDSIWSRYYAPYKSKSHSFDRINATSDGGFIMTGSLLTASDSGVINNKQAWIVKVDGFGFDYTTQWPDSVLNIDSESNNNIYLYPNPTTGEVFYSWWEVAPELRDNYTLEIYSLVGQLIKTIKLDSQSIYFHSLPAGAYPYLIRSKDQKIIKTGKLVWVQSKQ